MKTIKEWLKTLPSGYRERALKNVPKEQKWGSLSSAVRNAFSWVDTPEGEDFWYEVCQWTVDSSRKLPSLPPNTEGEMSGEEDSQFRCLVCGRIGTVGRCCGLDTREPLNDLAKMDLEAEKKARTITKGEGHELQETDC